MAKIESLGIKRLEAVHYYVHDLERSRRFYTEKLDFAEIGAVQPGARGGREAALARLPGRRMRGRLLGARRRGRRAPRAICASTRTASAR